MSAPTASPHPHEKRVQRYAYLALGAATLLALILVSRGEAVLLGLELPRLAPYALALLGALVGAVAAARCHAPTALAACVVLLLAVVPAGLAQPGILGYALGLLFGATLLVFAELIHMGTRHQDAHRAVEKDGVPEEHVNRVTDEAIKTLASRAGLALVAAAAAPILAYVLSLVGPAAWRDALETTATLGVAVVGLALLGGASLFILTRGASWRREATHPAESATDAVD